MKIEDRAQLAQLPVDTVIQDADGAYFQLFSTYPTDKPWEWLWAMFNTETTRTQRYIKMPVHTVGKEP